MNDSYTQISQYLTCPRRYRHRYLDGWQEKDTRAAMLFGRAFEQALELLISCVKMPPLCCSRQWSACQNQGLHYSNGDTWDRMLQQASSFWTASARTTAYAFVNRAATFRLSSRDKLHERTILSVTSMPSGS
jgi:hypothetical protein